jgi:hypothetical protein
MRARSQLARSLACGSRRAALMLSVGVGLLGCGPGFSLRSHGPTDIGARAPSAAARATAVAAPGAATAPRAPAELQATRDEELPPLPAPETTSAEENESDDDLEPAAAKGTSGPAMRYASLGRAACEAELDKRHIAYEPVGETRGVVAPLRLKGAIAGVEFHSMLPLAQRKTSPYEIYDCRLVLALDDWAHVLARHDVVEVIHYSVYRPPPKKQVLKGAGRRHSGALAIDAAIFKLRDGQTISVEKDFHGHIGGKPCGPHAKATGLPPRAVTLRELVCEAADAQLFNVMLTPDYNWPHRNHFHMEVTAGARWTFVR